MKKYTKAMDALAKVMFIITGAFVCAMVLIIFWQVTSRYFLNKTPRWSEEFTIFLMLYAGFLGAALAFRSSMHIGIKVFLHLMKPKLRNAVYFITDTMIGLFSLFMIFWGAGFAWLMRNQTLPATKIKVGYSYLPIPLCGILLFLFVIEKIMVDYSRRKTGATEDPLTLPPEELM